MLHHYFLLPCKFYVFQAGFVTRVGDSGGGMYVISILDLAFSKLRLKMFLYVPVMKSMVPFKVLICRLETS